jgi:hypothetical protein
MAKYILFLILGVLLSAWYLSFIAGRLDRLHHRVETSWEHLDALLQRRAAIAIEISHLPQLDPATAIVLSAAAFGAREASIVERSEAESTLSGTLALIEPDLGEMPVTASTSNVLKELQVISEKIKVGVVIHMESVSAARNLRAKFICRIFKLAGRAPLPVTYAFEDEQL